MAVNVGKARHIEKRNVNAFGLKRNFNASFLPRIIVFPTQSGLFLRNANIFPSQLYPPSERKYKFTIKNSKQGT